MAGGLCATIYDLAKFGEVMRNNGVGSNGNQIVPKWWIDDIRRNGNSEAWDRGEFTGFLPRGNYRNKWYIADRDRGAFTGIGIYGQYIYVDPEDEMIVARFSSQTTPFKIPNDHMWMRACRAIGAQLRKAQ
jgi:CubicO group peptidase (beta-lactamase class C family)